MAASTNSKPSRWMSSFVNRLESGLDTILADEEPTTKPKAELSTSESQTPVRSLSNAKTQDRLGEKLAKARANRAQGKAGDLSAGSSTLPTRTASPANGLTSPRTSLDHRPEDIKGLQNGQMNDDAITKAKLSPSQEPMKEPPAWISPSIDIPAEDSSSARPSIESQRSFSTRPSSDSTRPVPPEILVAEPKVELDKATKSVEEYEQTVQQMQADHEAAELRRQDETHEYLEKIDALQAKLQYLSKEAAEIAKTNISNSEPNSTERKIAQRDEQIALLMEEGHKLSQTELKHMSIIKKLRAKGADDETRYTTIKQSNEKNEKLARESLERAKRAELAEKQNSGKVSSVSKLERELEAAKIDRDLKASRIDGLQRKLNSAIDTAQNTEIENLSENLAQERNHVLELTEELSRFRENRGREERQHHKEVQDLHGKLEREKERARTLDMERQSERNALESRLEAFRSRAEEASTGSGGDSQVKLLRQIETLQNQSAVASENWQGIESSLLGRVASLEKERDEAMKKEAEVRRRARESNIKSRRNEDELESANAMIQDLSSEISLHFSALTSLRERLSKADNEIITLRSDLAQSSEKISALESQRMEDEKAHQRELESSRGTPEALYQQFRNDSPAMSAHRRKESMTKRNSPRNSKRYQGLDVTIPTERPVSRRSSTQPYGNTDFRPPSRHNSSNVLPHFPVNSIVPETPSIVESQADDGFFSGGHTPVSPEQTVADVISASTSAAGPSVQLVERMSAAVRRLESEKAASKEEMARLATQRDEARDQIVSLMREAEDAKHIQDRLEALESEKEQLETRLNASLDLLGEKSETVEELRADVQDLKSMYRELVETKVGGLG